MLADDELKRREGKRREEIRTSVLHNGSSFALLPSSTASSGGLTTLLDSSVRTGAFAERGFGGSLGSASGSRFVAAGSGGVACFSLSDFAEFLQVLLDGAGGAGGCVGCELVRRLGRNVIEVEVGKGEGWKRGHLPAWRGLRSRA